MGPPLFCENSDELTRDFPLQRGGSRAARRPLCALAELSNVNLQFLHRAAQCIAVHAQFSRSFALVAPVLLEHGDDEPLLEFADCLRIENVAAVHLKNERFQLIFHVVLSFPQTF